MKTVKSIVFTLIAVGFSIFGLPAMGESIPQIRILTTIKPLQLIANDISQDLATVDVLLPANASPHDYSLKPSDRMKLDQANVVLWVGEELERFLTKPITQQAETTLVLTAMDLVDMQLLPNTQEESTHKDNNQTSSLSHDHNIDPHVWLSPKNAVVIAKALASAMAELDKKHAAQYQQNLSAFIAATEASEKKISELLTPLNEKSYVVYHNAYGYFEAYFGLKHSAIVAANPELKPGAKHLLQVQQLLTKGDIQCVFSEPQFNQKTLETIQPSQAIPVLMLDPLAIDIPAAKNSYQALLNTLAKQFELCLNGMI